MRFVNILKILFLGLLIIFIVVFIAQHMYDVNVYFLTYTFKVPLFVLVLSFGFIGFIIPTLIFSFRERSLSSKLSNVFNASKAAFFSKYQKPKTNLDTIKDIKPLYFILSNVLKQTPDYDTDMYSEFEKAKSLRSENPQEAIRNLDNLEEKYPAFQLKRDILFDIKDYQGAYDTQNQVIKLTPRSEKPYQKDILNTIKSLNALNTEDKTKRLNELEDAFDDTKNELTAFLYLSELLAQEKTKDASKVVDNIVQANLQDKLILVGCSNPEKAVYLMSTSIEKSVSKDVLGVFYIHIGAPQKIKMLSEAFTGSEIVDFLLKAYQDQSQKDGFNIVFKSLKLWKCKECGETFKDYSPKCSCDSWFSFEPYIGL
ncbi:MAG: hypothetical protein ACP5E7_05370 [Hydrogenobaculum sp.]